MYSINNNNSIFWFPNSNNFFIICFEVFHAVDDQMQMQVQRSVFYLNYCHSTTGSWFGWCINTYTCLEYLIIL